MAESIDSHAHLDLLIVGKVVLRGVHLAQHGEQTVDVGRLTEDRSLLFGLACKISCGWLGQCFLRGREQVRDALRLRFVGLPRS